LCWGGFGVQTGRGGGQGGTLVWVILVTGYDATVIWVLVAGVMTVLIVNLSTLPVVGVLGWCGWTSSDCGGGGQGSMVSSWRKMRFIPSMSASDIANMLHREWDCLACST